MRLNVCAQLMQSFYNGWHYSFQIPHPNFLRPADTDWKVWTKTFMGWSTLVFSAIKDLIDAYSRVIDKYNNIDISLLWWYNQITVSTAKRLASLYLMPRQLIILSMVMKLHVYELFYVRFVYM